MGLLDNTRHCESLKHNFDMFELAITASWPVKHNVKNSTAGTPSATHAVLEQYVDGSAPLLGGM